jgi:MoaA/NifB/PqqE/SkfB family radical SAM enzyme
MKFIEDPITLFEKAMPGLVTDRNKNILLNNDVYYGKYHFYYIVTFPTFNCNNNCIYCYNFFEKKTSTRSEISIIFFQNIKLIKDRDLELIKSGVAKLTIAGGEPTLSDDYINLVRQAKKNGIHDIKIQTNGFGFSNRNFLLENMKAGINKIDFHIPSFNEIIFGKITRNPRAFKNSLIALNNLKETGYIQNTTLVFIINKYNYTDLPNYIKNVIINFNNVIGVNLFYVLKGNDAIDDTSILPRLNNLSEYLYEAMKLAKQYNLKLFIDYLPLCHIKEFHDFSIDHLTYSKGIEYPDSFIVRTKTIKCSQCKLNNICFGPTIDYIEIYGDDELLPFESIPVQLLDLFQINYE